MKNIPDDNFYNFSTDRFKDTAYRDAVKNFPQDTLVYITTTQQVGVVEEVRATPDGPRIRVASIGSIPIEELRIATDKEIQNSRFKNEAIKNSRLKKSAKKI